MDRQVLNGNRLIANFMQQRQKKRLQQRIKHIRINKSSYSSKGHIKQKPKINSLYLEKNIEIQKQNVALFTRIATIIKRTPKVQSESTTSLQKSRQTSVFWHRKIQSSLEEENKIIQKRLSSQKPTINNKLFYRQRANHQKYLKNMGKYPYILNRKLKTESDVNAFDGINFTNGQLPFLTKAGKGENSQQPQQSASQFNLRGKHWQQNNITDYNEIKQLFSHKSLDFTIRIQVNHRSDIFTFEIQSNSQSDQIFKLQIQKKQFIQFFQESEYDYEKMISRLRLDNDGNIVYSVDKQKKLQKTPKTQKQILKFKPNSTTYTSNGSKSGFRSIKRKVMTKNQNQQQQVSKSERNIIISNHKDQGSHSKPEKSIVLSQNKFADINLAKLQ